MRRNPQRIGRRHAAITQGLQAPEVKARLVRLGFDVPQTDRVRFAAYVRDDTARWAKVAQDARIQGE